MPFWPEPDVPASANSPYSQSGKIRKYLRAESVWPAQETRKASFFYSREQAGHPHCIRKRAYAGRMCADRHIKKREVGMRMRKNNGGFSLEASMTVEAALVLPLFLFFMMNVIFLLDVIRLQSRVTAALQQTGDRICEYAWYRSYALAGDGTGTDAGAAGADIPQAAGDILSLAYVSGEVRNCLGSAYMDATCLRGGSGGISYFQSKILSGDDIVEIRADYRTRPFIPILSGPDLSIQSIYYGHAWTGYEIGSGTGGGENASEEDSANGTVIVAENGVVYHTDPDCSYLRPDVREVDASDLGHLRANDGSIYHPCEYCHPSSGGTVYITPDGNRYHSTRSCSRITRTTHEESVEEASGHLRPCPKCGQNH